MTRRRPSKKSSKSPSQLIEERVDEMGIDAYGDLREEHKYTCMDTGMMFETYGEVAQFSPYTGSPNIMEEVEAYGEEEFMQQTGVPPSQSNPMKQTPLAPNPAPGQPGSWASTTQTAPNPAPDASGMVGATTAGPKGFVAYPQQSMQPGSVPPYTTKKPGERT